MDKYRKACRRQNQRYYEKTSYLYPPRPWTSDEDAMVLEHSMTDPELSAKIERSVRAIQHRRHRLRNREEIKVTQQEQYTRAWVLIDKVSKFHCSIKERNELQQILEILSTDGTLNQRDKESFDYWQKRYDADIETITNTIHTKIQEQRAIIEIANRRIEELEKQLES